MSETKIKALVFDVGGVLEFVHFNEFYKQIFNISSKEDYRYQKSREQHLRRKLDVAKITLEEYFSELSRYCSLNTTLEDYIKIYRSFSEENHELIDYLSSKLKKKFRLFILSNNSELFIYPEKKERYSKVFERQYYSYEMQMRKPNEKVFETLVSELGLEPNEILFIDDKEDNVFSAENVGLKGFTYTDFSSFKEFISSLN